MRWRRGSESLGSPVSMVAAAAVDRDFMWGLEEEEEGGVMEENSRIEGGSLEVLLELLLELDVPDGNGVTGALMA